MRKHLSLAQVYFLLLALSSTRNMRHSLSSSPHVRPICLNIFLDCSSPGNFRTALLSFPLRGPSKSYPWNSIVRHPQNMPETPETTPFNCCLIWFGIRFGVQFQIWDVLIPCWWWKDLRPFDSCSGKVHPSRRGRIERRKSAQRSASSGSFAYDQGPYHVKNQLVIET